MQKINFFSKQYETENSRNDECFGIVDDGKLARTVDANEKKDAVVINKERKETLFIPIDHNIGIRDKHNNEIPLCDGLLTTMEKSFLSFLEIKCQQKGAIAEATIQLTSTINLFKNNNDINKWNHRHAYVVNTFHPHFKSSIKIELQAFYKKTKFRLLPQTEIRVV